MYKALRPYAAICAALLLTVQFSGCKRQSDLSASAPEPSRTTPVAAVESSPPATSGPWSFATAANRLGFGVCQALGREKPDSNLLVSPLSLQLALGMTYNGAAGKTAEEMAATLGLSERPLAEVNSAAGSLMDQLTAPGQGCELLLANGLFCDKGTTFVPEFLQANTSSYKAEVQSLFLRGPGGADTINRWVSGKTKGLIPQIVTQQMLRKAVLVLTNALYFKGEWKRKFDAAATRDAMFNLPGGGTKQVRMMERGNVREHLVTDEFEAVRLPYSGEKLRMVVLLPKEGSTPAALLGAMTAERWQELMRRDWSAEGTLLLPRFNAESDETLNDVLIGLGMSRAFDGGKADFSKMANPLPPEGLFIDFVVQKCVVKVDEEGTEAAAATAVGMAAGGAGPSLSFRMVVDRPFVFAIEHVQTGAILMVGSVSEPG